MNKVKTHTKPADKRKLRIRSKIMVTAKRPRLTVQRSNKYLYLQVIDETGKVLAASNDLMLKKAKVKAKGTKTEKASVVAQDLVQKLNKLKIKKLVFDRGAYKYQGRVAAAATALREAGIEL